MRTEQKNLVVTILLLVLVTLIGYLFFAFFNNRADNLQGRIIRNPLTQIETEYTADPNLNGISLTGSSSGGGIACSDGTVVANVSQCGGHGCPAIAPCYNSGNNTCDSLCLNSNGSSGSNSNNTSNCWTDRWICETFCTGTDAEVAACRASCEAISCLNHP